MPVTHVPAQPAVTKIVEVSPATPYKVDRTLITLKGWRVTSAWTRRR